MVLAWATKLGMCFVFEERDSESERLESLVDKTDSVVGDDLVTPGWEITRSGECRPLNLGISASMINGERFLRVRARGVGGVCGSNSNESNGEFSGLSTKSES